MPDIFHKQDIVLRTLRMQFELSCPSCLGLPIYGHGGHLGRWFPQFFANITLCMLGNFACFFVICGFFF